MPPFTSDALVLRTYKLGETSRVVVLFTRERGKVRAVAKGARGPRSRYQSSLEPLSEVRVGLHGRQGAEMFRLGQCELLHSAFPTSARSFESAISLSYCLALGRYLEAWLLRLHGIYPPLDRCARCATRLVPEEPLWYHGDAHGFVCAACGPASGPVFPPTTRDLLQRMFSSPPEAFAAHAMGDLAGLEAFHRSLISRHLERELRSYRVLNELAREAHA